jgi:predicted chitinase
MRFNREEFFTGVREAWGALSQSQVEGLTELLDAIEADDEITDVRHIAYILATIKHETGVTRKGVNYTYQPIAEVGKGRGKPYGIPDKLTGQTYYGRGYVQLTWKRNYARMSELLGVDLVNEPDRAMEPEIAYQVTSVGMRQGIFTSKKLSTYIRGEKCDYLQARRIINAMDKAQLIAGYAEKFEAILETAQEDATEQAPEAAPIQNGKVDPPKASSTEIVKTTVVEETAAGTETKETTFVEKIAANEQAKTIAKTGMSAVGNRIAQGGLGLGTGGTILALLQNNWKMIVSGLVILVVGAAIWALVYYQRKQIQILTAQINSDKNRADINFK